MAKLRPLLMVAGILAAVMGGLWIGQGLGFIHWPQSSFMVERREWADYGAALAVFGLVLILAARRVRR